jgi:hypothetical protein
MRQVKVYDILIEFKFVPLSEVKLSGGKARKLSAKALQTMPALEEKMADAITQVTAYGDALDAKYGDLNLRRYAVVSLGYERIWWQAV